jgi:hypothetical protein
MQAERSQVPFLMRSLDFSVAVIYPAALSSLFTTLIS